MSQKNFTQRSGSCFFMSFIEPPRTCHKIYSEAFLYFLARIDIPLEQNIPPTSTSIDIGLFSMSDATNNINDTSDSSTLLNNQPTLQSESVLDTELPSENAVMICCSYSHCKICEENIHLYELCFQAMLKRNNVQDSNCTTEPTEFLCSKHCLTGSNK